MADYALNHSCPYCGHRFDVATATRDGSTAPKPGDYSFCVYCGAFGVWTDDLGLRRATPAESAEIANSELCLKVVSSWRDSQKRGVF